jgi:hypothetical protein
MVNFGGPLETGEKRKEKYEKSNRLSEANWLRRIFPEHRSVPLRAVSWGALSFGSFLMGRAKKGTCGY